MNISFDELVVLAVAGNQTKPVKRDTLAYAAAMLARGPKFDQALALAAIKLLEQQRLLRADAQGMVTIAPEGHSAVLQMMPVIEQLRATMGGCRYRYL